jgi:DNA-binding MarR family transcriptional regulator
MSVESQGESSPARITYLVKQVERGVRSVLDETVRGFGLTTPQYAALSVLARRGGLSSAQLARRAFVTPQAMNQIVGQLEAEGLITRAPDPANWRILRASLTREGERRLAACEAAVDHIEAQMLHALEVESVEGLREGLQACAAALRTLSKTAGSE